jgi:hypothetical protein
VGAFTAFIEGLEWIPIEEGHLDPREASAYQKVPPSFEAVD